MGDDRPNKKSILIVEDHTDTRDLMRRTLVRRGYRVFEASGAGDARVVAKIEHPDLLICDVGLGDGDGCDLLAELRDAHPSLQAIAVTGYAYPKDEVRCRAAGFGWFLTKPIEFNHLIATIEVALLAASAGKAEERAG